MFRVQESLEINEKIRNWSTAFSLWNSRNGSFWGFFLFFKCWYFLLVLDRRLNAAPYWVQTVRLSLALPCIHLQWPYLINTFTGQTGIPEVFIEPTNTMGQIKLWWYQTCQTDQWIFMFGPKANSSSAPTLATNLMAVAVTSVCQVKYCAIGNNELIDIQLY